MPRTRCAGVGVAALEGMGWEEDVEDGGVGKEGVGGGEGGGSVWCRNAGVSAESSAEASGSGVWSVASAAAFAATSFSSFTHASAAETATFFRSLPL